MDFEDFTLFDVFWKNKLIYLVLSINNNLINEKDLIVSLNEIKLNIKEKIVKDKYEPTLLFIYDDKNVDITKDFNIKILYNDKEYKNKIEKIENMKKKNFLALTTLFKNDYNLFKNFYEYYKNQGVEHFFMYYNGLLNDEIKKIFNYNDVTLIEWNFRYWNPSNYKYGHHAQTSQIHHALYKFGKDNYQYMIFNDLDEYLFIPNIKLINYIKLNPEIDSFGFKNIWSKTIDDNKNFQENLIISETLKYPYRSKCIHKISSIKTLNIHCGDKYLLEPKININNTMFHFYNWTKTNRLENTNKIIKLNLNFLKL